MEVANNGGKSNNEESDRAEGDSVFSSINKGHSDSSDETVLSSIKYLQERRFTAVTTSMIMIGHAAETGHNLKLEDVRAILDMADAIDPKGKAVSENHVTPELESKFWEALARVSNLIKPATAIAIRERSDFLSVSGGDKKNTAFSSTVASYKDYLWAILVLTMIVHSYYFYLGALITEAKTSIQRLDSARTAAFTAIASNKQNSSQVDSAIALNVSSVCTVLSSWRSSNEAISFANFHPGDATAIGKLTRDPNPSEKDLCVDKNYNEPASTPDRLNKLTDELGNLQIVDPITQKSLGRGERYLNLIDHFILPLLYGTLGALAYIIRSLSISIREIRYSRAFHFEYGLQIPLGALVGATVGLVISPETLNSAFGLTVLGLAFGFGYSVDVFFALIDGLISRLTQKQAPREVPPQGDGVAKL